ncbi:MAG TPA: hypothetical protein VHE55_11900 [Fimbriimonadaceae bacterium]|nr:hypothetical protein [Fimbriimonadaceae bacterium]
MEAPPPYMPPKKKSNTGLIIGLVVAGVLVCCVGPIVALVAGGLFIFKSATPLITCSLAYQDARDAVKDYAQEHNGKLPPAEHWQDEIRPYYEKIVANRPKNENPFGTMASGGAWGCDNGAGGRTGMAFNDDLSNQPLNKAVTDDSVVLFEVEKATENAHEKYSKPSGSANEPKIFGQPRGWFLVRMSGEPMLLNKGRETPVNTGPKVRVNSND